MPSNCAREGSGWTWGNTTSLKGWSGTGMGCPERWWSHRAWRCSRNIWTLCWGTWFSEKYWWWVNGWTGWSCGSFPTLVILWFYDSMIWHWGKPCDTSPSFKKIARCLLLVIQVYLLYLSGISSFPNLFLLIINPWLFENSYWNNEQQEIILSSHRELFYIQTLCILLLLWVKLRWVSQIHCHSEFAVIIFFLCQERLFASAPTFLQVIPINQYNV